jgi:hypothetical protein
MYSRAAARLRAEEDARALADHPTQVVELRGYAGNWAKLQKRLWAGWGPAAGTPVAVAGIFDTPTTADQALRERSAGRTGFGSVLMEVGPRADPFWVAVEIPYTGIFAPREVTRRDPRATWFLLLAKGEGSMVPTQAPRAKRGQPALHGELGPNLLIDDQTLQPLDDKISGLELKLGDTRRSAASEERVLALEMALSEAVLTYANQVARLLESAAGRHEEILEGLNTEWKGAGPGKREELLAGYDDIGFRSGAYLESGGALEKAQARLDAINHERSDADSASARLEYVKHHLESQRTTAYNWVTGATSGA